MRRPIVIRCGDSMLGDVVAHIRRCGGSFLDVVAHNRRCGGPSLGDVVTQC